MKTHISDIIKRYTPVVQWSEEDQLWIAGFPDLLGPYSRIHGNTPEEAVAALCEMAEFFLEDELADHPDGSTIAPPSTIITTPTPARFTKNPSSVEALRHVYGYSQADFARLLGVSLSTYCKWASTERKPSGAAARLLQVAEQHPEALGITRRRKAIAVAVQ